MNKKERQLAIKSAIAATADKKLVASRGHKVKDVKKLPVVVDNAVQASIIWGRTTGCGVNKASVKG